MAPPGGRRSLLYVQAVEEHLVELRPVYYLPVQLLRVLNQVERVARITTALASSSGPYTAG